MRSRLLVVTALVLSIVLCLPVAALAQRSENRVPPQKWKNKLSQPKYPGVESSIHYLKAADGAQLSLTLHLPQGLERSKRIPTLLQITPYQPLTLNARPTRPPSAAGDWTDFVMRGAAYVEADARGTNASDGCLDFGGKLDRADAKTFTRRIKNQR